MASKCSKSSTKTRGKSVGYVQGEIIQRKMSRGNSMGGIFREGYCLEGNSAFDLLLEIHFAINIPSVVRLLPRHRQKCFLKMFKNCEAFFAFVV